MKNTIVAFSAMTLMLPFFFVGCLNTLDDLNEIKQQTEDHEDCNREGNLLLDLLTRIRNNTDKDLGTPVCTSNHIGFDDTKYMARNDSAWFNLKSMIYHKMAECSNGELRQGPDGFSFCVLEYVNITQWTDTNLRFLTLVPKYSPCAISTTTDPETIAQRVCGNSNTATIEDDFLATHGVDVCEANEYDEGADALGACQT